MQAKTKTSIIICITLFALLFLLGCAQQSTSQNPVVKVGAVLPLSGVRADGGAYATKGLNMALDEINSDSQRKFAIDLVFEDSEYKPEIAASAMQKLVAIDGIKFVIGEWGSSPTLAMAPIAEKNKVIMITPWAQSDEITTAGDHIFRTQINTKQESAFFAEFLSKRTKEVQIIGINTAYLTSYIAAFQPAFEKLGCKIGSIEKAGAEQTDMKTELTKIKAANPTDILIVSVPKQTGLILKQAKELGIEANFYATSPIEGSELLKAAGDAAEGLIFPYPYNPNDTREIAKTYRQKYLAKFGEENEAGSAICYDTLYILSNCFEKVGTETEKAKQCLYDTQNFDGASGTISFDKNGDVTKNFIIKTIKNGKFVVYEE
ncbi:MAG: ABC transporter substrate-binding protein [Candidatus ainarchaeum sp.]|nr:ABC transporter substrate-binding protein [Candidatus ainarchaeum sp.]